VLYGYENVSPCQKFIPYCLLSFSTYEEYKWKHSKHPKHKKYSRKEGHLGQANSNGSILKAKFKIK
jgi:hypothetical protein